MTCGKVTLKARDDTHTHTPRGAGGERFPPKLGQAVARRPAIGARRLRRWWRWWRWRCGGAARRGARPPVFPRTMPNGAFVKVSSFTADAGAAPRYTAPRRSVDDRSFGSRQAKVDGRRRDPFRRHTSLSYTLITYRMDQRNIYRRMKKEEQYQVLRPDELPRSADTKWSVGSSSVCIAYTCIHQTKISSNTLRRKTT